MGSLRRSPDSLVGWGGDRGAYCAPILVPAAPRFCRTVPSLCPWAASACDRVIANTNVRLCFRATTGVLWCSRRSWLLLRPTVNSPVATRSTRHTSSQLVIWSMVTSVFPYSNHWLLGRVIKVDILSNRIGPNWHIAWCKKQSCPLPTRY